MVLKRYFFFLSAVLLVLFSCKREDDLLTDAAARLSFSTDTLTFDTVFTQIGSATRRFTIKNFNEGTVNISKIELVNGASSNFRFNVDGIPGPEVEDLEIRSGDSAFVFVEVTVDPANQNAPLVIYDALRFITNGNIQQVTLEAWGQDAYYYRPTQTPAGFPALSFLSEYGNYFPVGINMELPADKPHVIFGYLVIDSLINLKINAGAQIHFYDNAGLWAYRGSNLNVQGEPDNEVVFRGYRLEDYYNELPGQWDRIILNESPNDHIFNHARIENSFIGISAEYYFLSGPPQVATNKLRFTNSVITNTEGVGMLVRNYNVEGANSLITNSQNQLFAATGGGEQRFVHCTFANYWQYGSRQEGSLYAANGVQIQVSASEAIEYIGDQSLYFGNCIFYGPNDEELEVDSIAGGELDVVFDHCVLKTELAETEPGLSFLNCIVNPARPVGFFNPLFEDTGENDFTLHASSAAINEGSSAITDTLITDLKGDMRDAQPDLGCYEFIP